MAQLAPRLIGQGLHLEIVTLFDVPNDLSDELRASGVTVHNLHGSGGWRPDQVLPRLWRLVRGRPFDVFWGGLYFGNLYARAAQLMRPGSACVVTLRSQLDTGHRPKWNPKNLSRVLLGQVLRSASTVVANSQATAREHRDAFRLRSVRVVYNGVNVAALSALADSTSTPETRSGLGVRDDDFLIVTPGRFVRDKGHAVLLEAIMLLKTRHDFIPRVFAFGQGPLKEDLRQQVERMGLLESVTIAPVTPQRELFRVMAAADCVVLPTFTESFGMAVAEAMALGVPAIASRVGGLIEIDGGEGVVLLVPPAAPGALADAISKLRNDRDFAASLASRARTRIGEHFDLDRCVDGWSRVLRDAAARPRSGQLSGASSE